MDRVQIKCHVKMTTSVTFEVIGASPKGNGFQRVITTGPSEAIVVKNGEFIKLDMHAKDVVFTNKAKEPIPLSFEVVGALSIQNQYGFLNYNVRRAAFDLFAGRYQVYLQVVDNS